MVPVTTMEELPVLDDSEREKLIDALKAAEADVAAGRFTKYDPKSLRERLVGIYKGGKRAR